MFDMSVAVDLNPDTQELDRSEIHTQILLATASSRLNNKHSFTHMLNQVRDLYSDTQTVSVFLVHIGWTDKNAANSTHCDRSEVSECLCEMCSRHSGSRVAAVDPVSLTGNAAVFAHSEYIGVLTHSLTHLYLWLFGMCVIVAFRHRSSLSRPHFSIFGHSVFAVSCPTTWPTKTLTSRKHFVDCTVMMETSSSLHAKVTTQI